jgi:MYXO-CTERM domain-containing protein
MPISHSSRSLLGAATLLALATLLPPCTGNAQIQINEVCATNVDEDCDGTLDNGCGGDDSGTDDSGNDDSGQDSTGKNDRDKGLFGCSSTSTSPAPAALLLGGLLLARRRRQA